MSPSTLLSLAHCWFLGASAVALTVGCMAAWLFLAAVRQARDDIKMHMHSEIEGITKRLIAQVAAQAPEAQKRDGIMMVGCSNVTLIIDSVVNGRQYGDHHSASHPADSV